MNRLLSTMRYDFTLQYRNGFYAATLFITVLWVLVLLQAGAFDLRWLLPPMVIGNLLVGTFFFLGALVLLEKSDGTLTAQVVTPLRISEYLSAKVISLSALAIAETLVIVLIAAGWNTNLFLLLAGAVFAAVLYCLFGFIAVARYTAINDYLIPAGGYVTLIWLPLMAYFAQWWPWAILLHPMSAPLVLVRAAFETLPTWQLIYGFGYSALWIVLLFFWSRRVFRRWIIGSSQGA